MDRLDPARPSRRHRTRPREPARRATTARPDTHVRPPGARRDAALDRRSRRPPPTTASASHTRSVMSSAAPAGDERSVPASTARFARAAGADREVEVEVAGGRVDAQKSATSRSRATSHPCPTQIRRASTATPARSARARGPGTSRVGEEVGGRRRDRRGEQRGGAIGEQVDVGLDAVRPLRAETEDPQRDPRVGGRDHDVDRRPVALAESLLRPRGSASNRAAMKIGLRSA